MKHAANPRDFSPEMLLPRIRANARPDDFLPVEQMQLMKFDGEAWRAFGDVINGEVGHQPAVRQGAAGAGSTGAQPNTGAQEFLWIDRIAVDPGFVVQMRTGRSAG
jgi:hypothetical protein